MKYDIKQKVFTLKYKFNITDENEIAPNSWKFGIQKIGTQPI